MVEALFSTLHLLGALGMAAGLIVATLATGSLAADSAHLGSAYLTFRKIYALTAVAIVLSVGAGVILWLVVGKPAAFFSNNPVFHAKMALVATLLATLFYPAWYLCRPQSSPGIPATVLRLQKCALPLMLVIPALAYLMARGIGY
jgi:putative membrane protein